MVDEIDFFHRPEMQEIQNFSNNEPAAPVFQKASSSFVNEVKREESQSRLLVLEENKMQQLGL